MPLSLKRDSNDPFTVPATRRELPVESCPPAARLALTPSVGLEKSGVAPGPAGASTSGFASAGGAPVGGGGSVGVAWARAARGATASANEQRHAAARDKAPGEIPGNRWRKGVLRDASGGDVRARSIPEPHD